MRNSCKGKLLVHSLFPLYCILLILFLGQTIFTPNIPSVFYAAKYSDKSFVHTN